jgi:hypothetical protein
MAKVEDWAPDFLCRHCERFPRPDWPELGSEFWLAWISKLKIHGVTEAVADEASRAMIDKPPAYLDRHWSELLEGIKGVWAASEVPSEANLNQERAMIASRNCPECGGGGLTFRRFLATDGQIVSLAFDCLCAYGHWRHRSRQSPEPSRTVSFNLADYPDLWDPDISHGSWPPKPHRARVLASVRKANGQELQLERPLLPWKPYVAINSELAPIAF